MTTRTMMLLAAFTAALCAPFALVHAMDAGPSDAGQLDAAPTADATPAAPTDSPSPPLSNPVAEKPLDGAKLLYSKIASGEWLAAFGVALMFIVWIARFGLSKLSSWFEGKAGGYLIALVSAFGITFGSALSAGAPFSFGMLGIAIAAAWTAAGGRKTALDAFNALTKKKS